MNINQVAHFTLAMACGLGGGILLRTLSHGEAAHEAAIGASGGGAAAHDHAGHDHGPGGHGGAAAEKAQQEHAGHETAALDAQVEAHQEPGHLPGHGAAGDATDSDPTAGPLAIDLQNPECPLMGGDTDGSVFVDWQGLRVHFCCPGCDVKFLEDPAATLAEAGIEYEPALQAMQKYTAAAAGERPALLAEMRECFQVVGSPAPPPAEAGRVAINLANPACPVMGGDTDGSVFTHWKGLRVQFCCAGCEEAFLKEPEANLEENGVEYKAALLALREYEAAAGEERETLLEAMRGRFDVVELDAEGNER